MSAGGLWEEILDILLDILEVTPYNRYVRYRHVQKVPPDLYLGKVVWHIPSGLPDARGRYRRYRVHIAPWPPPCPFEELRATMLVDTADLCRYLGVSMRTLRRYIADPKQPLQPSHGAGPGSELYFSVETVNAWLKATGRKPDLSRWLRESGARRRKLSRFRHRVRVESVPGREGTKR